MKLSRCKLLVAAVTVALFIGCQEVAELPDTGNVDTVIAPSSIIGRQIVHTFTKSFTPCTAMPGTILRYWFVDENTIRGFRDDGTFDYPTKSWNYERTGGRSGRITMAFTNRTGTVVDLDFETDTTGYASHGDTSEVPVPCLPKYESTFELIDPPVDG